MAYKYHENGITTGQVDYYCLVCDSYLRSKEDADNHMIKPVHKKNLQSYNFCEQFQKDNVRKLRNGYFCEFCNLLLPTMAKVNLHTKDKNHHNNRGLIQLKRIGNFVIAYGNVKISESAWHGFVDSVCVLCSVEFENGSIHKTVPSHLINLIHKKLDFNEDSYIYRKIDEDTFQCLTCNKELALSTIDAHFESNQHKIEYKNCCDLVIDDNNNNGVPQVVKADREINSQPTEEAKPVEEAINNGAIPKITLQQPTPIKKKQVTNEKVETAAEIDERICNALNAKDYIIRDVGNNLQCIICEMNLIEAPARHLAGMHHRMLTKLHKERVNNNYQTKPIVQTTKVQTNVRDKSKNSSKILDSVGTFQKNDININFETSVAYCRKCSQTVEYDYDTIQNHIDSHKKTQVPKEPVTLPSTPNASNGAVKKGTLFTSPVQRKNIKNDDEKNRSRSNSVVSSNDEIDELAKQNNLVYNEKRRSMQCETCKVFVPRAKKNILEHINGWNHVCNQPPVQNRQQQQTPEPKKEVALKKVASDKFVKSIATIETLFVKEVLINDKYCITFDSFMMVQQKSLDEYACLGCDKKLKALNVHTHVMSFEHKLVLGRTPVVVLPDEFVREIRNQFHCGACNIVLHSWPETQEHFLTVSHKDHKNRAQAHIDQVQQEESDNDSDEEIDFIKLLRIMHGLHFN